MMFKKLKKYSCLVLLFLFTLFPVVNVDAAVHTTIEIPLTSVTSAASGNYNMGSSEYHVADRWFFHQVQNDNLTLFLAYCLDHGKNAIDGGSGTISTEIDDLGLTEQKETLLKNILASGVNLYNVDIINFLNTTDDNTLRRIVATQILVWEVMSGGRTNYNLNPGISGKSSYDFVHQDPRLETEYANVLNKAKTLTIEPGFNNKIYIMHWADSKSSYILKNAIPMEGYNVSTHDKQLEYIIDDTNSTLNIASSEYFKGTRGITLNYSVGSSMNYFQWFNFNKGGNQRIALGAYGITKQAGFEVMIEQGTFTLAKYNDKKKLLKGSAFDMYKCSSTLADDCKKVQNIDLTTNPNKEITINKSGLYMFKETKVPFGHEKVPDFFVNLTIDDDGTVTAKADASSSSFLSVEKNGISLKLNVINESKNFRIRKIDGITKEPVKGASFKIKNSKNKVMKFNVTKKGNDIIYEYSDKGSVDTLKDTDFSDYTISLLPEGEYLLEEIGTVYPYNLSTSLEERQTKFKIDKNSDLHIYNYSTKKYDKSTNATITVKNFKTSVKIIKSGHKGKKLEGVVFELWDSKKQKQIPVKESSEGYEYNRDNGATPIQLVTNEIGEIIINYLPEGSYYLKEISTVDGHEITEENMWTNFKVTIKRNSATDKDDADGYININNAKSEFCFYKIDENGNYLDDGVFTLQVYDSKTSRFEDVPIILDKNNNVYNIDEKVDGKYTSDVYKFSPLSKGQTCFVDVPANTRYRIVEIEAPEGFILPKISETQAELIINENGYAIGAPVIINRKITTGEGAEAQAELIINISTGQNRIHYIVIITVLLVIITGLIILKKKIDKK